ncbi:MAG: hypothetical protein J7501_00585 [Bdellovibrio sp.]|nr:hypothetical protein [Bdellovibrio sp.]
MRLPLGILNTLVFSAVVLLGGHAYAFKPVCEYILSEKFSPETEAASHTPEYAAVIAKLVNKEKVSSAMSRYQKVMSFDVIDQKGSSLDLVKTRFKALTPEQKKEMIDLVSEIYNDVKLLKYSKDAPYKFFKRHLDMMITEYVDAPRFFRNMINKRNASVEKTLDLYFKQVQEITKAPVVLEGSDILLSSLRMKYQFVEQQGLKGPLVLYGSFVNGRAYERTSDMDSAVIDPRMEQAIREFNTLNMLEEFPLSDALPHVVRPHQLKSLGYMNSVVVVIQPQYIEIRVYQSQPEKVHLAGKAPYDAYYF